MASKMLSLNAGTMVVRDSIPLPSASSRRHYIWKGDKMIRLVRLAPKWSEYSFIMYIAAF